MGSLSNVQVLKLLAVLNIPDQGSYSKNMSALKQGTLALPVPVKNEDRSTAAPPKPTTSRHPPSFRNSRSSREASLAPTEDSGYFSSITGSVASATSCVSTRSRSQTPAIRQQSAPPPLKPPKSPSTPRFAVRIPRSPPSVSPRTDTPGASPSQVQETGTSTHFAVIPPIDESPASDGRVPPVTETPVKTVSEENLGMMEKKKKKSYSDGEIPAESIFKENLGATGKNKEKGKGKEAVRFDELPVVHEADLEELYRDLCGNRMDSRIVPWPSSSGRIVPNIGPSHSKRAEPSSRDLETRRLTRSNAKSSSSSPATTVSSTNVRIPIDAIGATEIDLWYYKYEPLEWKADQRDFDSDDDIDGVELRDLDSDDDIDGIKSASLWDRERIAPLTEQQLDFYQKVFASSTKTQGLNGGGDWFNEGRERIYRSEVLVHQ